MAALLELSCSQTVFAKAIFVDDPLADPYRREAQTAARLPDTVPTPRMLFSLQAADCLVLVFEAVAGHHPRLDYPNELAAVLRCVEYMGSALTPSPLPDTPTIAQSYGPELTAWQQFADEGPPRDLDEWSRRHLGSLAELEAAWCPATVGDTLLHTDLRPDNMLVRHDDGTVVVVDWAWSCRGAAWVDLASLVPSLLSEGVDPSPILASNPITAEVDPAAIDAFICALGGYWARNSRLPSAPRSPHLRIHQAHKAELAISWIARRVGWQ